MKGPLRDAAFVDISYVDRFETDAKQSKEMKSGLVCCRATKYKARCMFVMREFIPKRFQHLSSPSPLRPTGETCKGINLGKLVILEHIHPYSVSARHNE